MKQEIKDEDTEKLKQKINLQLQLIRAQELLYQQKVQQEEEEKNKVRGCVYACMCGCWDGSVVL